ncbi:MAG: OmpH family outer membrane protein [Nitrospirae bacterium]|nr:OmpH family outer membrane protein [Nitrospirota bacterium]MCL5978877.1 OmpH family outer membrane protein [Nitrospirota bacterium]
MKKILVAVSIMLCIAGGTVSKATAAEALKVGIVDLFMALNESEAGKKAKTDLESLIKSKQTVIDEKGKKLEALKGELEKQTAIISAEARKAKEEELERLARDFQRIVTDSQAEVKKKEGELTGGIIKDLRDVINKIAQEEGYSLILERAEGLVLYAAKPLDITDRVIKKHNEPKTGKK